MAFSLLLCGTSLGQEAPSHPVVQHVPGRNLNMTGFFQMNSSDAGAGAGSGQPVPSSAGVPQAAPSSGPSSSGGPHIKGSLMSIQEMTRQLQEQTGVMPEAHRIAMEAAQGRVDKEEDPHKIFQEQVQKAQVPVVVSAPLALPESAPSSSGGSGVSMPGVTSGGLHMPQGPSVEASPSIAPPVSQGVPVARLGPCDYQGANTVLSRDCFSRLPSVPSVISQTPGSGLSRLPKYAQGIPLPSMGPSASDGAPVTQGGAQSVINSLGQLDVGVGRSKEINVLPGVDPQSGSGVQPVATPVSDGRVACSVADSSGIVSRDRVLDMRSCLVEAIGLLQATHGPFSVIMVDSFGSAVSVSCRAYGMEARPVCGSAR